MAEERRAAPGAEAPVDAADPSALEAAWERGELRPEPDPVPPPRGRALPPSFLGVAAAGLLFLAWEPLADLPYALWGPSTAEDLGAPGAYRLERARDGGRVRLIGLGGERRGRRAGEEHLEVFALKGLPVLVQRPASGTPPPGTVEQVALEGRLLRLDDAAASPGRRFFHPAARWSAVRDQFAAMGELPLRGERWLLLDGELPRSRAGAILGPLLLLALSLACAAAALRGLRRRRAAAGEDFLGRPRGLR